MTYFFSHGASNKIEWKTKYRDAQRYFSIVCHSLTVVV